ncbi:sulfatase [bacterium]|nr:sulfatase [bacterium]
MHHRFARTLVCLLPAVFPVLAGCDRLPDRGAPLRDVVIVLIDTQRPDHFGFGGYAAAAAPFLASLARRSLVAGRAYSTSSWTPPSTASVFTSLYPEQHGVIDGFEPEELLAEIRTNGEASRPVNRIPPVVETLPEAFRDAGYRTFGISANLLVGEELGFADGFDRFAPAPRRIPAPKDRTSLPADSVFARLDQWADELAEEGPDLVYLHLMDAHWPYGEHEPWFRDSKVGQRGVISAYDSETSLLDQRLQDAFRRYGWDDAIVVVLSDHGEEFREHGMLGHEAFYHQELARVLMMFHDPDRSEGALLMENASLIDVLPTVADLAGLPGREEWEGTSLLPAWSEGPEAEMLRDRLDERVIFARRDKTGSWPGKMWAAIEGDWKLVSKRGVRSLYNLRRDPRERRNVLRKKESIADDLAARYAELVERSRSAPRDSADVRMDSATIEELRALGYVQ